VSDALYLAGCGKSTWAARYVANHPERRYVSLSIDGVLKQMKVIVLLCMLLITWFPALSFVLTAEISIAAGKQSAAWQAEAS